MKPSRSRFAVLMLPVFLAAPGYAAEPRTNWVAVIKESDAVLKSYGFPSKIVEVTFPKSFPTNVAKSLNNYRVFLSDTPDVGIPIKGVRLGPNLHGDEEEDAETPSRVSRTFLLPESELSRPGSDKAFIVHAVFGNEASGDITVTWPATTPTPKPPPSGSELLNILTVSSNLLLGRLDLQADVRSAFDGEHVPVIDFSLKYDVARQSLRNRNNPDFNSLWIVSGSLEAEGTYKFDETDTNVADNISISANAELLRIYRLPDPLTKRDEASGSRQGKLAYYAGFRLKAFELEADQEFDVINWSVQPQFAAWVPYSNIPAVWWVRNVGIHGNAASPLFVGAGFSLVDSFREDATKVSPAFQKDERAELELAYAFPVTSKLRIGVRSRFFWLLGEGVQRNYQECFVRYYLDAKGTTALLFKYTHGALPPKFEKGETTSAGFSFEF